MAQIILNVEKKYAFLIVGVLILIAGGIAVYAYNTNSPSNFGHSFGELENVQYKITNGLTSCSAANLAIKTIDPVSGAVTCETDDSGGGGSGAVTGSIVGWGYHQGNTGVCLESIGTCGSCVPNTAQGSLATCDSFLRFNCPSGSDKFRVSTEPSTTVGWTKFIFICIKD